MNYGDLKECRKCHEHNIQVVKYIIKGGRVQYRYQCLDCGYVDIDNIKQNTIPNIESIPLLDEDLKQQYYDNWDIIDERNKEKKQQEAFEILGKYYQSKEWQTRRKHRLAFNQKFFGGKCERCGMNDAEVVHHRSYEILDGKEHAFDLECLCRKCHALIHPHLREEL